jgi:hypothetical protein
MCVCVCACAYVCVRMRARVRVCVRADCQQHEVPRDPQRGTQIHEHQSAVANIVLQIVVRHQVVALAPTHSGQMGQTDVGGMQFNHTHTHDLLSTCKLLSLPQIPVESVSPAKTAKQ